MKILECSSNGDKRFSALYAIVNINGKSDTIENHYQLAKRFGNEPKPKTWKDAKGRKPTHFEVNGKVIPLEHSEKFYDSLWEEYLRVNSHLMWTLLKYDDYSDMFKSKNSTVCQADSIRRIVNNYVKSVGKVYRVGYSILSDIDQLVKIANDRNAYIIDIRYKPNVDDTHYNSKWNKDAFEKNVKIVNHHYKGFKELACHTTNYDYRWYGDVMGNENYYDRSKPIHLIDEHKTVLILKRLLRYRNVILLCGCKDGSTCHGRTIQKLMMKEGFVSYEIKKRR